MMVLTNCLGYALCVALAGCILRPTPVVGTGRVQTRSSESVSCTCQTTQTTLTCSAQPTGCGEDEKPYGGSCYAFVRDDPKNHLGAHRHCVARAGHLVYIESQEEQDFLAFYENLFYQDGRGGNERYWTGLVALPNFIWLDGSPLHRDLFNFHGDHGSRPGCIYVQGGYSDIVLYVGNCGGGMRFLCEFPLVTADVCQGDDEWDGESCYVFFDQPLAQSEAQAVCQTLAGGHLLYMETQDEQAFIEGLLSSRNTHWGYWIGSMTQYVWLDSSPATYQAFDAESHNSGGRCFRMYPWSNFKWNDRDCTANYAFVCERELMVPEKQANSGEECRTPVDSLNYLLKSGSLCVRTVDLYYGVYFLCPCGQKTCIKGCGCAGASLDQPIMCNCGQCDLTVSLNSGREPYADSEYEEWPVLDSTFLCECSDDVTPAEYYKFRDGVFVGLNATCGGEAGGPSPSIAGPVVAAVIVLLLIAAAIAIVVAYRKGARKVLSDVRRKRASRSETGSTGKRYEGNNHPSDVHRNPAFDASASRAGPDEDYTYISPDTSQPSRQPDKQHPLPIAPYQPKRKNAGYVDGPPVVLGADRGSDPGPNLSTTNQAYNSLTQPIGAPPHPPSSPLEGGVIDGGYQALTKGSLEEVPETAAHNEYNHLQFKK